MTLLNFWKTKPKKAKKLKKALRFLDPHHPLWQDDELGVFYVDRNLEYREEIIKLLRSDPNFPKFLLSGPPGCGKATELGKINSLLKKKFHVILFSAKDMTNNYKVNTEAILNTIFAKIAGLAKEKKPDFYQKELEKLVKRTKGWETKYAEVMPEEAKLDPRIAEQIEQGIQSYQGEFKQVTRLEQKPSLNEIIGAINKTSDEFLKKRCLFWPGKKILIMISDLDKIDLESARELFFTSALALIKIKICAIFTFPLALKYDKEFIRMYRNFNNIYFMETFPIHLPGGKYDYANLEKLKEIITRRINENLIDPEVMDQILLMSGGIPFELINIMRECCKIAIRDKFKYVDQENLNEAIGRIRATYQIGLTEKDKEILRDINLYNKKVNNEDLTRLLNQYWVTEYGKWDDVWYDINPILIDLIKETKLFDE